MESRQLSTCAAGKLLAKASDPHFPLSVLRLRGGSGDALGESLEEDEFTDIPKQEEEHHLEDISQPLLFDPMIINMDNLALRSLFPSPFQPQVVQAPLSSPLFHQCTIYLYNAILLCERDKLAVPQDLLDAIAANAILACRYGLTAIGCFGQRLYSRCQQHNECCKGQPLEEEQAQEAQEAQVAEEQAPPEQQAHEEQQAFLAEHPAWLAPSGNIGPVNEGGQEEERQKDAEEHNHEHPGDCLPVLQQWGGDGGDQDTEHQGEFLPVLRLWGGDGGDQDTDQYPAMLCTTRDSLLLHWTTTSKEWRQKV